MLVAVPPNVRPPLATVVPEPDMVPPVQVNAPLTVSVPAPVSVPPVIVRPPPIVNVVASDSVSLSMPRLVFALAVRLLTVSVTPVLSVTVPVEVRLMTASSVEPGATPPIQFEAVSQLPPVGWFVLSHVIVESTIRCSRPSIEGLRPRNRLRMGRCCLDGV